MYVFGTSCIWQLTDDNDDDDEDVTVARVDNAAVPGYQISNHYQHLTKSADRLVPVNWHSDSNSCPTPVETLGN